MSETKIGFIPVFLRNGKTYVKTGQIWGSEPEAMFDARNPKGESHFAPGFCGIGKVRYKIRSYPTNKPYKKRG